MVEHPLLGRVRLLSVYSRQQAIEDGTLVDCTQDVFDELNRQAGLKFDVAMTAPAFDRYVAMSDQLKRTQDLRGRYWDLVWMFRNAALREGYQSNETCGLSRNHRLVTLKAVCGPGDRGEPCVTFMLPDED
jgi:hypothetical protein